MTWDQKRRPRKKVKSDPGQAARPADFIRRWRAAGLTLGSYRVILADPPWDYQNWTQKANGAAVSHYATLGAKDLKQLPVGALAADECALALWCTSPKLPEAIATMEAWGFQFVTVLFVWVKTYREGKPYMGLGFYSRSGAEYVLLGKKKKCPPRKATNVLQVVDGMNPEMETVCDVCGGCGTVPVRFKEERKQCPACEGTGTLDPEPVFKVPRIDTHSTKPENVPQRIEKLWDGPYVELFARRERDGWDVWGDQISNHTKGPEET